MEPTAGPESTAPARWAALALVAAAVVAGVAGHLLVPWLLVGLLVVALVWAAVTLWLRTVDWRSWPPSDSLRASRPLEPGESFDKAVKLTFAPNVPVAESICSHLRSNGIEAFVKRIPTFPALSAVTNDFDPAEIWVAERDLIQASRLLDPQISTPGS